MSFDFGDVGSFFGDIGSWVNNNLNPFSESTPATTGGASSGGSSAGASNNGSSWLSSISDFFSPSSTGSSGTSNVSPSASSTPVSAGSVSDISKFLTPTAATTTSAAGAGRGWGNTDSILSTMGGATASPAAAPSTIQQITSALGLDKTSTGDLLKGAVGAGGLGYALSKGSDASSAQKKIEELAGRQGAQGQQLESYLANGTLPPGAQSYVDQQTAGQKAAIRSKYASMGMSGSTAEVQELNNVDQQAMTQMFSLATQLYNTGVSETGASSNLYALLMDAQNQDNALIGNAISNFVSALGGEPAKA